MRTFILFTSETNIVIRLHKRKFQVNKYSIVGVFDTCITVTYKRQKKKITVTVSYLILKLRFAKMKSFLLVVSLFVAALNIYVTQVAAETPIKCTKPNEEFANCGDVCPVYCDTRLPHPCPRICKIGGGCVCKKGYVRKSKRNPRCILRKHCPKKGK